VVVAVLEIFLEETSWMTCAAIELLCNTIPKLVKLFQGQLTDLIDSPIDAVAAAAQSAVPLLFMT
jgi:hypothetical protein